VLEKTQVTTSSASSRIALGKLPSLHSAEVSVQPGIGVSAIAYVPAGRLVSSCCPWLSTNRSVCPEPRPSKAVPMNANTVGSPAGFVCIWTMTRPAASSALVAGIATMTPAIAAQVNRKRARKAARDGAVLLI